MSELEGYAVQVTLPVPDPANHANEIGHQEGAPEHQWLPDHPAFSTHDL